MAKPRLEVRGPRGHRNGRGLTSSKPLKLKVAEYTVYTLISVLKHLCHFAYMKYEVSRARARLALSVWGGTRLGRALRKLI